MSKRFKDKHVLITGGSEGIGLELAILFVTDGATVTLLSRSPSKLQAAQERLKVCSLEASSCAAWKTSGD